MKKPNILLITDDQHRWDFYDNRVIESLNTPNLTRLMREGVTLTHSYSNCPICMPTRFTWLYGLYAGQCASGLLNNHHDWPVELPSMAHALQSRGYHTALIGKLHSHAGLRHADLLEERHETEMRGFDDVFETSGKGLAYWYDCNFTKHLRDKGLLEEYRVDIHKRQRMKLDKGDPTFLDWDDTMDTFTGDHAVEWLQNVSDEKPFFLHLSFCGPHVPYDPPGELAAKYNPEDMPPPECAEDEAYIEKNKKIRAAYSAMIEHVDDEIGRSLAVLEERGLLENTVIFFGTDHGDMMGHHQQTGKLTFYDTSTRTPYVVRFPDGCNKGVVLEGMVEAVDLPCSILEAGGCASDKIPKLLPQTPGRSFLLYARGEVSEHRNAVYSECRTMDRPHAFRMLREHDWKYVFTADGDLLFDMKNDPFETENLIDCPEHLPRISDMRRRLISKMAVSVPPSQPNSTYADGDWWIEQQGNAQKAGLTKDTEIY